MLAVFCSPPPCVDSTGFRCHELLLCPRSKWAGEVQLPVQIETQRNSSPHPPHPLHIIYEWEWCRPLFSCSFGMCKIDRFKTGTQMALKAQCSAHPLRGKVSSWAITVIMAAHVLDGLDKQWLWWQRVRHVGSMDNGDQCNTAA